MFTSIVRRTSTLNQTTGPVKKAAKTWLTVASVATGFFGTLYLMGSLNRFFFADLVIKVPEDLSSKDKNPAEEYPPSKLRTPTTVEIPPSNIPSSKKIQ